MLRSPAGICQARTAADPDTGGEPAPGLSGTPRAGIPMAIRPILRMGDPRLLAVSAPVRAFGTPELLELIADMEDTMRAANGAGLAAPQIGVSLRVVIFGGGTTARYPDADAVPYTVLVNPKLRALRGGRDVGLGGVPVGAGHARPGAASSAPALSRFRPVGPADRPYRGGFSCARRAARGRSPRWRAVSDTHQGPAAISASSRNCSRARSCGTTDRRRGRECPRG